MNMTMCITYILVSTHILLSSKITQLKCTRLFQDILTFCQVDINLSWQEKLQSTLRKRMFRENIQLLILVSGKNLCKKTYVITVAAHLHNEVCIKMLLLFHNVRNLRCNYYHKFICIGLQFELMFSSSLSRRIFSLKRSEEMIRENQNQDKYGEYKSIITKELNFHSLEKSTYVFFRERETEECKQIL